MVSVFGVREKVYWQTARLSFRVQASVAGEQHSAPGLKHQARRIPQARGRYLWNREGGRYGTGQPKNGMALGSMVIMPSRSSIRSSQQAEAEKPLLGQGTALMKLLMKVYWPQSGNRSMIEDESGHTLWQPPGVSARYTQRQHHPALSPPWTVWPVLAPMIRNPRC